MTGGTAVILGRTGANFGAGMTGGMAFILDEDGSFPTRANPESILWQRLESAHWEAELKSLIAQHAVATDSKWSNTILDDRSEEHTSELQSLMRISYAVFCLKKKKMQKDKQRIKQEQET